MAWITRAKSNTVFTVQRVLLQTATVCDRIVLLGGDQGGARHPVRLIEVRFGTTWYRYLTSVLDPAILPASVVVDLYRRRWRIEFNFRDAKQYWGLEDFMNVSETAVPNAVNLSLFTVNVSQRLLGDLRPANPDGSVLDLKALCRGAKYVSEAIKMLPEKPEPVVLARILKQLTTLGRIHMAQPTTSSP